MYPILNQNLRYYVIFSSVIWIYNDPYVWIYIWIYKYIYIHIHIHMNHMTETNTHTFQLFWCEQSRILWLLIHKRTPEFQEIGGHFYQDWGSRQITVCCGHFDTYETITLNHEPFLTINHHSFPIASPQITFLIKTLSCFWHVALLPLQRKTISQCGVIQFEPSLPWRYFIDVSMCTS